MGADGRTGWIAGDDGDGSSLLAGGARWAVQRTGTNRTLWGVHVGSAAEAWAVGDDGLIVATADGGATWVVQTVHTPKDLRSLACLASLEPS